MRLIVAHRNLRVLLFIHYCWSLMNCIAVMVDGLIFISRQLTYRFIFQHIFYYYGTQLTDREHNSDRSKKNWQYMKSCMTTIDWNRSFFDNSAQSMTWSHPELSARCAGASILRVSMVSIFLLEYNSKNSLIVWLFLIVRSGLQPCRHLPWTGRSDNLVQDVQQVSALVHEATDCSAGNVIGPKCIHKIVTQSLSVCKKLLVGIYWFRQYALYSLMRMIIALETLKLWNIFG